MYIVLNLHADNAPASATTASPWQAKVKELIWETDDSHARFRHDQWRKVFTEDGQDYFAAPLQERLIPFTYYMTKEDIYGRLLTYSQFAVLQGDDLQVSSKPWAGLRIPC